MSDEYGDDGLEDDCIWESDTRPSTLCVGRYGGEDFYGLVQVFLCAAPGVDESSPMTSLNLNLGIAFQGLEDTLHGVRVDGSNRTISIYEQLFWTVSLDALIDKERTNFVGVSGRLDLRLAKSIVIVQSPFAIRFRRSIKLNHSVIRRNARPEIVLGDHLGEK